MWSVGTLGVALPSFFWAMLFQLAIIVIYLRTGIRPLPTTGTGLDAHLIGPTLALAARPLAYVLRATAVALDQERQADYTRLARGKGLSERAILVRHLAPNVAPTVIAALTTAARATLSSLLIVEFFFNWPGAGSAFIEAIAARRIDLAAAIALVFVAVLALVARAARLLPVRQVNTARE
jgi:peptide/nickel transport system permease protein